MSATHLESSMSGTRDAQADSPSSLPADCPSWEPTCPQAVCKQPSPCPGEEESQLLTVRRALGPGGPGRVKGIAFI